jgi:pilus assembly protein Flp/PilA
MSRHLHALADWGQTLIVRLTMKFTQHREDREGQGLVEYALILALIAILVIIALKFLQPQISNTLNKVSNNL